MALPASEWPVTEWPVLISESSYCNTGYLVMIHMISVKNAFSLSSVVCLDSASDASARVFAGPGAELAGPEATDLD